MNWTLLILRRRRRPKSTLLRISWILRNFYYYRKQGLSFSLAFRLARNTL